MKKGESKNRGNSSENNVRLKRISWLLPEKNKDSVVNEGYVEGAASRSISQECVVEKRGSVSQAVRKASRFNIYMGYEYNFNISILLLTTEN